MTGFEILSIQASSFNPSKLSFSQSIEDTAVEYTTYEHDIRQLGVI